MFTEVGRVNTLRRSNQRVTFSELSRVSMAISDTKKIIGETSADAARLG